MAAKRIHVNDMLKSLYKIYDDAEWHYESLCEFVHPNFGSNTLVSSGTLASGEIGSQSDLLMREMCLVRDIIERCAELDSDLVLSGTRSLLKLSNWVSLASRSNAKISHVFSLRSAHGGDGLAKDSAIFFSKARTHHEAIEAFHSYIRDKNLEVWRRRQVCLEDGWLFDIVITNKGSLWVKYKIDE